jgi:hypothetical protein
MSFSIGVSVVSGLIYVSRIRRNKYISFIRATFIFEVNKIAFYASFIVLLGWSSYQIPNK